MKISLAPLAIAGSLAAALSALSVPAFAEDAAMEKCYGVALKGQNDCASANHNCAGHSTADYDKASWKNVPTGTCVSMNGSLEPGKS
jgi:uncharacterized membrane protein